MIAISVADRQWTPGRQSGVERVMLRDEEGGGRTQLIRMARGSTIENHGHIGREEVLMVSGSMRLGDSVLHAGDYHHTGAGEFHDVEALEDCVFYAMTEKVIAGR
jgi:quercetin dioxygenase-like cupin family protein